MASKLHAEVGDVLVSHLIYSLGREAENVYRQINMSADDGEDLKTDFDLLVSKFDDYFMPKVNAIFERQRFNTSVQAPGEPFVGCSPLLCVTPPTLLRFEAQTT